MRTTVKLFVICHFCSRKHVQQRYKSSVPNIYVEQTSLTVVNVGAHFIDNDDDNKEPIEEVEM